MNNSTSENQSLRAAVLRRGFTLIELLVVIAIIALLVSILLPSLNKAKELARSAVCRSNLHTITLAGALYTSEAECYAPYSFATLDMRLGRHQLFTIHLDPKYSNPTIWPPEAIHWDEGSLSRFLPGVRIECPSFQSVPDSYGAMFWTSPDWTYGLNLAMGNVNVTIGYMRNPPLPLNRVPRPAETVYWVDSYGLRPYIHFPTSGFEQHVTDNGVAWSQPYERHNEGRLVNWGFVDAHCETAPLDDYYTERAFGLPEILP